MSKIFKFMSLKLDKKLLLAEAVVLLGISRAVLKVVEFKRIAPYLGQHMNKHTKDADSEISISKAGQVRWAVSVMSKYTPWESKCLVQAMAAKIMLRRRGIKSTIYLGVARDGQGKMIAHAWLESCGRILTGAAGADRFTVVSVFGD